MLVDDDEKVARRAPSYSLRALVPPPAAGGLALPPPRLGYVHAPRDLLSRLSGPKHQDSRSRI